MDIIGKRVRHNSKYGEGTVVKQIISSKDYSKYILVVKFDNDSKERKFSYPDCIGTFLTLIDISEPNETSATAASPNSHIVITKQDTGYKKHNWFRESVFEESTRDDFSRWLLSRTNSQYSHKDILSCIDWVSDYAVRRGISSRDFWSITEHVVFNPIYQRLSKAPILRMQNKKMYKTFLNAGQLYLQFLRNLQDRNEATPYTPMIFSTHNTLSSSSDDEKSGLSVANDNDFANQKSNIVITHKESFENYKSDKPQTLLFSKSVDWSLFHYGFAIPKKHIETFYKAIGLRLSKANPSKRIQLKYSGGIYAVSAYYFEHTTQVRWTKNDYIAKEMRAVFYRSYEQLKRKRNNASNHKSANGSNEILEYLDVFSTGAAGQLEIVARVSTDNAAEYDNDIVSNDTSTNASTPNRNNQVSTRIDSNIVISKEDVISWLVTQPNANGTLYLESVVRQYMNVLSSTPPKFDVPDSIRSVNLFTCSTPNELYEYLKIFKAAPNYKQVNSSVSGMFSAAFSCYMRYLKHRVKNNQKDETDTSQVVENHGQIVFSDSSHQYTDEVKHVDFNQPEQCTQSKPLSCSVNGQNIIPGRWNWSQILVAITEHFISEDSPHLASLNSKPLRGNKAFFLNQRAESGTSAKLSNGKWIYTNYNPEVVVTVIKNLCCHCRVDLSDVCITYMHRGSIPNQTSKLHSQSSHSNNIIQPEVVLDSTVIEEIAVVLAAHYSNGFRLASPIEKGRIRKFAAEDLGKELTLSDEKLVAYIKACGTNFEGKIYIVSDDSKSRIKTIANDYFANGAKIIFFDEFYRKNENWLSDASVVSIDMLIDILQSLFTEMSFTRTYFGYINTCITKAIESEFLRVWGNDILLNYDQLAQRLPYVPLDRIKQTLALNGDFIWNSVETFTHISKVAIGEDERNTIRNVATRECNSRSYVSITDLPLGEIENRNYELSITAIHNAVYRICLTDKFDKRGKIITRKGDAFDALTIMKEYCKTIDKCSLDDLLNFEKELTGENHRWIPMEAGNSILVRVDEDTYVADNHVQFDIEKIDEAIGLLVKDNYRPLKAFTTFVAFPYCGHSWNLFLLESYCRRFSSKFRFDALSVNSRNAGTVVRTGCTMNYTEIMIDAVANADVPLNETAVGQYLSKNGYIARSSTSKIMEILENAKSKRERMD